MNQRVEQAKKRLESYDAYYPGDPDLWPTALKNSIEDNRFLLSEVERLEKELAAVLSPAVDNSPIRDEKGCRGYPFNSDY